MRRFNAVSNVTESGFGECTSSSVTSTNIMTHTNQPMSIAEKNPPLEKRTESLIVNSVTVRRITPIFETPLNAKSSFLPDISSLGMRIIFKQFTLEHDLQ
ncbi:hypothetical protein YASMINEVIRUS_1378 [Yasminevirus sp. GU-2018]|uniref:Uncharacterized protein n=1 Tax=Yasminevirus sp. GU-2018 TaxID=2420051 RepID=A0A5K0UC43_9VIRU|nr:hypothetical protein YASMINEVIRUS_1378 [Yasminevirus sp. GU-2018]